MIEAFRFKKRYYLVFEYMEGTILDELEKNPDGLGDEPCRERIFQITRAIMYCHENNVSMINIFNSWIVDISSVIV